MFEKYDVSGKDQMRRSSNLELLRIICMFIIVMHHFALHSGFAFEQGVSFNKLLVQGLLFGGKLGVNCFVIISGYFLVKASFSVKKLFKLVFQVWFYGLSLLLVCAFFDLQPINLKMVAKSLMPIYELNWFAYTYMILYIVSPFINIFVNSIDRNKLAKFLFLITFFWSLIPSFTGASLCFSELGWFIYLYMVGAYLQLYPLLFFKNIYTQIKIFVASLTLTFITVMVFNIVGLKYAVFAKNATYYYSMNSIFMLIAAVSMFLIFQGISMNYNKFANNLALTMFGVYLIHDNPLIKKFIWHDLFNNVTYSNRADLWLHALWVIPTVFIVCATIDWLRILYVERPILALFASKLDRFQLIINKKVDKSLNELYQRDDFISKKKRKEKDGDGPKLSHKQL